MTDILKHCLYLEIAEMENSSLAHGFVSFHPLIAATSAEKAAFYQEYSILVDAYYAI